MQINAQPEGQISATSFGFGPFRLDTRAEQLYFGEKLVHLSRRPYLLLKLLLEAYPAAVHRDQIMKSVWRDACVEDNNVDVQKHILVAVLKEHSREDYIKIVPGRSLRFPSRVTPSSGPMTEHLPPQEVISAQEQRAWEAYGRTVIDSHLHRPVTEFPYARRVNAVPSRATMGENADFTPMRSNYS